MVTLYSALSEPNAKVAVKTIMANKKTLTFILSISLLTAPGPKPPGYPL